MLAQYISLTSDDAYDIHTMKSLLIFCQDNSSNIRLYAAGVPTFFIKLVAT
jgi:hypothetical protein